MSIPRLSQAGGLTPARRVLLRSGWQSVNIGDIGHTPGAIEIIRRFSPATEIVLWPSAKGLEPEVRLFLSKNYPGIQFAEGAIVDGQPSTESLAGAFQTCDFMLHSSGSGFPARADVGEWSRLTGKPYGIFPVSLDPVSGFGPGRDPEGGTLAQLRKEILSPGKHPLDEKTRKVIDGAAFMFCRDSISEVYLRREGVKTPKLAFGPDTQFGMSVTDEVYATAFCRDNKLISGQFIHLPQELADDLQTWRFECEQEARDHFAKGERKSSILSPEEFIFANRDGGFMDTGNYRKRVLHKLARDLNLPKLTFQVIRRTIATLAQKKGTVKDVQGVLRHSRAATTTDVYMQEIPESVQSTINSINEELRGSVGLKRKKPARTGAVGASRRTRPSRLTPNDTKSLRGGNSQLPAYA